MVTFARVSVTFDDLVPLAESSHFVTPVWPSSAR